MNVVVTGLSPREEAAFGMFMGKAMKDWSWRGVPAERGVRLPTADLLVADLVALGLAQWSEAAEARLLESFHDMPAVLLLPAHDQTWASQSREAARHPRFVWLRKPYNAEGMRAALRQASMAKPVEPAVQLPASRVAPAVALRVAGRAPEVPAPDSISLPAKGADEEVPSLTAKQLQTRLAALPDDSSHVFLRQLSTMLSAGQPFEARFTFQHSMIVHPGDDWVASNTPMTVIERVCQSDALASVVSMRTMDTADAEVRAQRLGMPVRELETFLWELAAVTLDGKPSQSSG